MTIAYSYIRWSSEKQSDGTSEARQGAAAVEYAKRHGLRLSEKTFLDAATSAYRGKNLEAGGALRAFLDAVDDGHIAKGSLLLIENFDRMSRLPPRKAMRLLEDIVERGIVVVTLDDGRRYNEETLDDFGELLYTMFKVSRGHTENKRRADLIKESFVRRMDAGQVLSAGGPSWLRLEGPKPRSIRDEDTRRWVPIPEKVAIVKQVFEMASVRGLGSPTIAIRLNEQGVPLLGDADVRRVRLERLHEKRGLPPPSEADLRGFWTASNVAMLLKNEAVLGSLTRTKARANTEPGYYGEPIIPPAVFDQVKSHVADRVRRGGRGTPTVGNLMAGLLRCECGSGVRVVSAAKPHSYLRCLNAASGAGCKAGKVPYEPLEAALLEWLLFVEEQDLNAAPEVADPRQPILDAIRLNELQAKNIDAMMLRLIDDEDSRARVEAMFRKNSEELRQLKKQLQAAARPQPLDDRVRASLDTMREHQRLKARTRAGPKLKAQLLDMRERLRTALRGLLREIVLVKRRVQALNEQGQMRFFGYALLRGEIVDASREPGVADALYRDGGFLLEYELPAQGFGDGVRRAREARAAQTENA